MKNFLDYKIKKMVPYEDLYKLRETYQKNKIVHCHGVFDVIHPGHLQYLEAAKNYGDILVVTLTCDRFVNKGPGRPYFDENKRSMILAALEITDFISISPNPTAIEILGTLKPDFYVKGKDYQDMKLDETGGIYLEKKAVEEYGGKLVFTDSPLQSSSEIVNKINQNRSSHSTKKLIENSFHAHQSDEIRNFLKELQLKIGLHWAKYSFQYLPETAPLLIVNEVLIQIEREFDQKLNNLNKIERDFWIEFFLYLNTHNDKQDDPFELRFNRIIKFITK